MRVPAANTAKTSHIRRRLPEDGRGEAPGRRHKRSPPGDENDARLWTFSALHHERRCAPSRNSTCDFLQMETPSRALAVINYKGAAWAWRRIAVTAINARFTASFQLYGLTPWSLRTCTGVEQTNNEKKKAGELPRNTHHRHLQDGGGITAWGGVCIRDVPL